MIELVHLRQFNDLQRQIDFCYLCGEPLPSDKNLMNRDHVVPRKCFHSKDREPVLILRVHRACHKAFDDTDHGITQLIGLAHGRPINEAHNRLRIRYMNKLLGTAVIDGVDVEACMWKWIRGFHAALYNRPLFYDTRRFLHPPLPRTNVEGGIDPIPAQFTRAVQLLKDARMRGEIDVIKANKGQLRYECVWSKSDQGPYLVFFAIDLYGWKKLGARNLPNAPLNGCAGFYTVQEKPDGAALYEAPTLFHPNYDPYDPFGI